LTHDVTVFQRKIRRLRRLVVYFQWSILACLLDILQSHGTYLKRLYNFNTTMAINQTEVN